MAQSAPKPPPLSETKPWEADGFSRATWYRRRETPQRGTDPVHTSSEASIGGDAAKSAHAESKEDMRKRGVLSPDEGGAAALCFTEPEGSSLPRNAFFGRKIEYPGNAYV